MPAMATGEKVDSISVSHPALVLRLTRRAPPTRYPVLMVMTKSFRLSC